MHSFAARFRRASARAIAAGVQPQDVILPAEGMIRGRDGTGLHYLEWPGPRAEPVLLFLHGGGLHAHTFDVTALLLRPVGLSRSTCADTGTASGRRAPGTGARSSRRTSRRC